MDSSTSMPLVLHACDAYDQFSRMLARISEEEEEEEEDGQRTTTR
jgi:hypothetical protein